MKNFYCDINSLNKSTLNRLVSYKVTNLITILTIQIDIYFIKYLHILF